MNDASVLDSAKQLGDDAQRTLLQRQTNSFEFVNHTYPRFETDATSTINALSVSDGVAPHRAEFARVTPPRTRHTAVDTLIAADREAEDVRVMRRLAAAQPVQSNAHRLAQLVQHALSTPESNATLRRANHAMSLPRGPRRGVGLALEYSCSRRRWNEMGTGRHCRRANGATALQRDGARKNEKKKRSNERGTFLCSCCASHHQRDPR